eukprot:1158140-Pelagomonas_calceolata.AAC.4
MPRFGPSKQVHSRFTDSAASLTRGRLSGNPEACDLSLPHFFPLMWDRKEASAHDHDSPLVSRIKQNRASSISTVCCLAGSYAQGGPQCLLCAQGGRNVFSAREFVWWYNGHPDGKHLPVDLRGVSSVAVCGIGKCSGAKGRMER